MPIDFPNSPVVGQEYTVGDITWVWDGTTWSSKVYSTVQVGRDKANTFLLMGA